VISSGNGGSRDSVGAPGCVSTAVSVGSSDVAPPTPDTLSSFSDVAGFLNLLAPGSAIESSVPGGGFDWFSGTSMAAPHVAGAWAVLKAQFPNAGVDAILNALTSTGRPIRDTRSGGSVTKPRIRLDAATESLLAAPLRPTNLQVANVTNASFEAGWQDNAQSEARYELRHMENASGVVVSLTRPANSTSAPVTGLYPNRQYGWQVRACDASNRCSPWTDAPQQLRTRDYPLPPVNLRADPPTATSIRVFWDVASHNHAYFNVRAVNLTDGTVRRQTITAPPAPPPPTWEFTGLARGRSYQISVQACNAERCSDWSQWIVVRTLGEPPAAPSSLRICPDTLPSNCLSVGGITLRWSDNATNEQWTELEWTNGRPDVEYGWSRVRIDGENVSGYTFSPVDANRLYHFRVRACNEVGCSNYSNYAMWPQP
jgi:hypothetical protein